jgi:DNA polymerase delta subunit 3
MLYDFHKYQNAQKANSVYATYLVYGTKIVNEQYDSDVEMSSSIPDQEETPVSTLTLAREEELRGV